LDAVRETVYAPVEVNVTSGFWLSAFVPLIKVNVSGEIVQSQEVGVSLKGR
jgi:hypothetical protein